MDVIVIGCGASGVAALRKLHDAGLRVMGFEAADRIGGRIHTVEYGKSTVDLGAAWCHGEKNNIVFELAEPLGLLGRPNEYETFYLVSNGELVPRDECEEIISVLENKVTEADKNNNKSISECVWGIINNNEILQKQPAITNCLTEIYAKLNHLGGEDDPKTGKSLKGLDESDSCEGEFMLNWKERGYKSILDVLLNRYPDPSKEVPVQIHLNKEVTNIRWSTTKPGDSNPLVQVKCKDGSLYATKSVIVTVSLGVLKERHTELFNPSLPQEKINSINNLNLCIVDKIYVEFNEPWWSKPSKYQILWREEDKKQFSEEDKWIAEMFCVETVEYQPNLLRVWIYGNAAVAMEKLNDEEVRSGVETLMKLLGKRFPVTPVKSILRSQWATNPLIRCAYAYRSVATEENGGGAAVLSEPLYHKDGFPVVCFAGEATSHRMHSAVHGAIEAGFREASRLINYMKK